MQQWADPVVRKIREFNNPVSFTVGTIGLPGERTFYLQVKQDLSIASVSLEKQQVSLLAQRILEMVRGKFVPNSPNLAVTLELPLIEDFRVGVLALAFDSDANQVVLEIQALTTVDDQEFIDSDSEDGPELIRIRLTPSMAYNFSRHAQLVVKAGRLPCPFCGLVIEPSGHICPRENGYRR